MRRIIPLITTVAMVLVLLGLGFWQLQRRTEKAELRQALAERLATAPQPLPASAQWPSLHAAADEFRRIRLTAEMAASQEAWIFTSGSPLRPDVTGVGYWAFAPARLDDGSTVVVNRGFVPAEKRAAAQMPVGRQVLIGVVRFPERRGWLTPTENIAERVWYVRDPAAMAAAHGWGRVAPFYIDLESPEPLGGLPKPGPLAMMLPDNHLQYALTWFGLALAVIIAFGVWWRRGPGKGGENAAS